MRVFAWVSLLLLSAHCRSEPELGPEDAGLPVDLGAEDLGTSEDQGVVADAGPADTGPACEAGRSVVSFETSDGVKLEADLSVAGPDTRPVVLLHMIPPSNDRSNYPAPFIEALESRQLTVLNLDRRGAGGSEGVAREAYEGPKGARDVAAAVGFLGSLPCNLAMAELVVVGASNGTTSALDHAVGQATAPRLVFLTGGGYTENQTDLSAVRERIPELHLVWGRDERPARTWAEGFRAGAPAGWAFSEFSPGAHGTRIFGPNPEAIETVANWIAED